MDSRWNVADSPHWRDGSSLAKVQLCWLVALIPALAASVIRFGTPAIRVILLALGTSIILDALANRILPGRDHTDNWSSATLGLLLASMLPLNAPWWLVVVGCFLTIVVGKKLFGGWGGYPVHPAALSLAMLQVSWPSRMDYTASLLNSTWKASIVEPMRLVKGIGAGAEAYIDRTDLLLGTQAAGIFSGMVIWLLLGGLLLLILRQISWRIPLAFLVGVLACSWILELLAPGRGASPLFQILAGGTVLAAFFLMPEHTTSPVNRRPMLIYGLMGGILLVLIRTFSSHVDGVIFTVLLMNLFSPLLDRLTPKIRGLEVSRNA